MVTLPSKKIQALIIIVIAVFIGYFLYSINFRERFLGFLSGDSSKRVATLDSVAGLPVELDTDKDGLRDWQEELWKTDLNNADTDGDGTEDGKEVADGRDPTVPGPNDTLVETRGVTDEAALDLASSINKDPNNLSTTFSRSFFAQFMSLESKGGASDEDQGRMIEQAISSASLASIPPAYSILDLNVVDTNSATLRAYGNDTGLVIKKNYSIMYGNNNNAVSLNAYRAMIDGLKQAKVPGVLGINHLQMINTFELMYTLLNYTITYQNDPLKALLALKDLQELMSRFEGFFANISIQMESNGIIFNKEEPGLIWN